MTNTNKALVGDIFNGVVPCFASAYSKTNCYYPNNWYTSRWLKHLAVERRHY